MAATAPPVGNAASNSTPANEATATLAREMKMDGGDNATLAAVGEFLLEGLYVNNRLSKYNGNGKAFFRK